MPAPTWPNLSSALPIQAEELETRQDIAGRYDQIVADQRPGDCHGPKDCSGRRD